MELFAVKFPVLPNNCFVDIGNKEIKKEEHSDSECQEHQKRFPTPSSSDTPGAHWKIENIRQPQYQY